MKNVFLSWLFLGVLLQAKPVESYVFLKRLAVLEQNFIAFSRNCLLAEAFPYRHLYALRMRSSYDTYERAIRQMASDLKGSAKRQMILEFVNIKEIMKDLLALNHPTENLSRLLQKYVPLKQTIEQTTKEMILALDPEERVRYALAQMKMVLEALALDYEIALYRKTEKVKFSHEMARQTARFERLTRLCSGYAYWSDADRAKIRRIVSTWDVLKHRLSHPGHPLVTGLGVEHIGALIDEIRSRYDEEQ